MFKLVRSIIGGCWLKIKTYGGKEVWIHPTCPFTTRLLMNNRVTETEYYKHCFCPLQYGC